MSPGRARQANDVIESFPEPQRAVVKRLRGLILEVAPDLEERVSWGKPVYARGGEVLFSLIPHTGHVNLQLFDGASLAPSFPEIEGTGKRLRHVKVRRLEDCDSDGLRAILREAVRAGAKDAAGPARDRP